MRLDALTDNLLRRMSKKDRASLGKAGRTSEEAQAAFVARSEKELQDEIARLLSLRRIAFYRSRMDKRTTGTLGWPDFTLCVHGIATALEVKHGTNDLDPDQVRCIKLMRENGWAVYVVRSLDGVRRILEGEEIEEPVNNPVEPHAP